MNIYETFDNYNFDNGKAFEIVETTSSLSGYPENLRWALTGFAEWDEAEEAAKALDGEQSAREYWDGESVALADALQRGELDAEGLAAWSGKISKTSEEIADADEERGVITRRGEFVEVIDLRPMPYHDRDVTAYQIAVIINNR